MEVERHTETLKMLGLVYRNEKSTSERTNTINLSSLLLAIIYYRLRNKYLLYYLLLHLLLC